MAVKGSATVTLTSYRDTQSVTRYYKLQTAGSSAPSKPTTKPPSSDWTDSEPDCDISKGLYFCDLTIFSNGEWEYSSVSKSSSYEAAKEAYNKAQSASDTASAAKDSIDNLEVGGRNLLRLVDWGRYRGAKWYEDIINVTNDGYTFTATGDPNDLIGFKVPVESGVITISGKTGLVSQTIYFTVYDSNGNIVQTQNHMDPITENGRFVLMLTMPSGASELHIGFGYYPYSSASGDYTVSNLKIEKGNKATDWTPAPEDVDAGIANAQTTANDAKAKAEAAQTAVSTKVETSVFNTLKNTVDENSANITSLTKTVTTKADSSTVTTLSNTVNQVKQTVNANSSSISGLTTTVNSKADGSKVTALENKTSTIEQNLSGVTTRVTTLERENDGLDTRLTAAESKITDDAIVSTVTSSKTYKDALSGKVDTSVYNTKMQQLDNSISLKATATDVYTKTQADAAFDAKGSAATAKSEAISSANSYTDTATTDMATEEFVTSQGYLTVTSDAITSKVSKNEVISAINQTAESVSINANKINLNGAVTISSLDNSLQTTINNKAETSALENAIDEVAEITDGKLDISDYDSDKEVLDSTIGDINTEINGIHTTTDNLSKEISKELVAKGYAKITNEPSLELGRNASDWKIKITNSSVDLQRSGISGAKLSPNPERENETLFRIDTTRLSNLYFRSANGQGKLGIVAQSNGHVSLKEV